MNKDGRYLLIINSEMAYTRHVRPKTKGFMLGSTRPGNNSQ
jgi:hypothetical protein